MFKTSDNIDVRVLLFTGHKIIFMARDAEAFRREFSDKVNRNITFKYSGNNFDFRSSDDWVELNLLPLSVNVNLSFNNAAKLTMVFSNNKGRFLKRNNIAAYNYWDTWKDRSAYTNAKELEYVYQLFVKKFKDNQKKGLSSSAPSLYDKTYNLNKTLSMPYSVLEPSYLCYVQVKDRAGNWRNIFGGFLTFYDLEYQSAKSYTLTVEGRGFSNLMRKVPLFADFGSGPFLQYILPKDEKIAKFLLAYYASFRKVGDFWKQNFVSFNRLRDFVNFIIAVLNYRMGLASYNDIKSFIKDGKFIQGLKELKPADLKNIENVFKDYMKHNPFQNGIYKNVKQFKGFTNIWGSVKDFQNLFDNYVLLAPEFYGQDLREVYGSNFKYSNYNEDIIEVFKKFIGLAVMGSPFHPNSYHLSSLLERFANALGLFFADDGFGNLVIDFIRYNQVPNFDKKGFSIYKDHDDRYIIDLNNDVLTFGFYENAENMRTALYLESDINIPNASIGDMVRESLYAGHSWADPEFLLRYGYRLEILNDIYLNMNYGKEVLQFINEYSRAMLDFINAREVSHFNIVLNQRPDLQLGRSIYFSHLEKLGVISGITHNIVLGNSFRTTLDVRYVHNIDYKLREPKMVIFEYANKVKDKFNTQSLDSLVDAIVGDNEDNSKDEIAPCNLIRVPYVDFPADLLADVHAINPKFKDVRILKTNDNKVIEHFNDYGVEYVMIDERLYDTLLKVKENYEKKIGGGVIVMPEISSIWRFNEDDSSFNNSDKKNVYKSRHFYGRAVDISGISFGIYDDKSFKALFNYLKKIYQSNIELDDSVSFDEFSYYLPVVEGYDGDFGKFAGYQSLIDKDKVVVSDNKYRDIDYSDVDMFQFPIQPVDKTYVYNGFSNKRKIVYITIKFHVLARKEGHTVFSKRKKLVDDFIGELQKIRHFIKSNREYDIHKDFIISCGGRNPFLDTKVRDCAWVVQNYYGVMRGRDYYHARHIHVSVGLPNCNKIKRKEVK